MKIFSYRRHLRTLHQLDGDGVHNHLRFQFYTGIVYKLCHRLVQTKLWSLQMVIFSGLIHQIFLKSCVSTVSTIISIHTSHWKSTEINIYPEKPIHITLNCLVGCVFSPSSIWVSGSSLVNSDRCEQSISSSAGYSNQRLADDSICFYLQDN